MKAIYYERYGPPDVLELREVEAPTVGDDQVLIRVRAASLNASDWESLRGKPLYTRVAGLLKPKNRILGSDVAGTVEAVGGDVEMFRPGDEVFGDIMWNGAAAFAEYVAVSERAPLVRKPPGMTFEEAAALPQAAVIAVQGLAAGRGVAAGDAVLVNGAGGGAGTFAVQIAKAAGAEVTGVDHGGKLDGLRALGADDVVDYTREDCTKMGRRYDVILDVAAHRSILAYRRALTAGGTYSVVGGSLPAILQAVALGPVISRVGDKTMRLVMVKPSKEALTDVLDLVASGTVRPLIDSAYPLAEVPAALRRLGEGRAFGKVVVSVGAAGGG